MDGSGEERCQSLSLRGILQYVLAKRGLAWGCVCCNNCLLKRWDRRSCTWINWMNRKANQLYWKKVWRCCDAWHIFYISVKCVCRNCRRRHIVLVLRRVSSRRTWDTSSTFPTLVQHSRLDILENCHFENSDPKEKRCVQSTAHKRGSRHMLVSSSGPSIQSSQGYLRGEGTTS